MGLQGMFVVEENRPDNWLETLNVGAGQVRHPSVAVREQYASEYDLHYMDLDKSLHELVQKVNDPRLIARAINRTYNITKRVATYFLLNGRSFPYTFRESLVVVKPDEKVKLRVLNGGMSLISLHPHGQAVTETDLDGIEVPPAARVTRDVVAIAAAQRVDLLLDTTNDGLHSYGDGVWLLHDHNEHAFTTDGVSPGGSISAIAYESYLDATGWPITHGIDWKPFFSPDYYRRKIPVWVTYDDLGMLGEAGPTYAGAEASGRACAARGSRGRRARSAVRPKAPRGACFDRRGRRGARGRARRRCGRRRARRGSLARGPCDGRHADVGGGHGDEPEHRPPAARLREHLAGRRRSRFMPDGSTPRSIRERRSPTTGARGTCRRARASPSPW